MGTGDLVERELLWAFYGSLLTPRQQETWRLRYQLDWSLAEVAAAAGISRAAVQDQLHRAEAQLAAYEAGLHLVEAWRRRRRRLQELRTLTAGVSDPAVRRALEGWAAAWAEEEGLDDV
ncbi:conserved protein of unknown function [Candidatus Hydrogenisulfobacillus filiaventi]|uniref:Uncharacterized protein n=1 Tax=Candidatus Hydrogenisulfobacillus filiaventi TaxID=2707344 RepID=A0A6F8ZHL1_9FIRM|nr:RNA polymerase subunit sigma-70 [Bacillota bacterium]CAB1129088.1 conserved protein of unknown function [Candidatus Hydrogenisulfobacillus filiaventi]